MAAPVPTRRRPTTGAADERKPGGRNRARRTVEAAGFAVVGGFVSPSHEQYVAGKCRNQRQRYFPTPLRAAAAALATAHSDWIAVGRWEAWRPGGWPDYPEVAAALRTALRGRYGHELAPQVLQAGHPPPQAHLPPGPRRRSSGERA